MNNPPPIPPPYNSPNLGTPGNSPSSEERNWAVVAHLSAFLSLWTAYLSFAIPLLIWLLKRDDSQFIATQAKEALNFQISLFLWGIFCVIVAFTLIGIPLAILLAVVIYVVSIICPIIAAIKVSNGEFYQYPLTLRLIS